MMAIGIFTERDMSQGSGIGRYLERCAGRKDDSTGCCANREECYTAAKTNMRLMWRFRIQESFSNPCNQREHEGLSTSNHQIPILITLKGKCFVAVLSAYRAKAGGTDSALLLVTMRSLPR
ncbi:hypothetical protein AB1N83_008053 [Pleurotus pulmonarius]